jgi:hypothetical protein
MDKPTLNEQTAWDEIANAADQVAAYYLWCHEVLTGYEAGQVTQTKAAGMMRYPPDDRQFSQLDQAADVQIIMTYADDIFDGGAYMLRPDSLERDWRYIAEVVSRHI